MISPQTSIIVLLIVLLLFGGKKIPEIMAGLGKGLRTFKKTMEGEDVPEDAPAPPPPPASLTAGSANGPAEKNDPKQGT